MLPSLSELLATCTGVCALLGAVAGFAWPASSDRDMIDDVAAGAQVGAVVGVAFALAIWAGGPAAGS